MEFGDGTGRLRGDTWDVGNVNEDVSEAGLWMLWAASDTRNIVAAARNRKFRTSRPC